MSGVGRAGLNGRSRRSGLPGIGTSERVAGNCRLNTGIRYLKLPSGLQSFAMRVIGHASLPISRSPMFDWPSST
jgi:hypothetical protein